MSFAIAAAGTGGHVFPGLAVGEALVSLGIDQSDVLFVGGDRLEATVYPAAGFTFLGVELAGLQRRFTVRNARLPVVVRRAVAAMAAEFRGRSVQAVLGLGGYVTVPAGLAAGKAGAAWAIAEQNSGAGLANRVMSRRATRVFGSFPTTRGLPTAEWVGNPLRRSLTEFERSGLRPRALDLWGLDDDTPVVGVFGGSLGARAVDRAVIGMMAAWAGPPVQLLHIAGRGHGLVADVARVSSATWVVLDFCQEMDLFYAACDLVVARAGGSVAEITATATPSILMPGGFGSSGHQAANAKVLEGVGAARVVPEKEAHTLGWVVSELVGSPRRRRDMAEACLRLARPQAASVVARALVEMAAS